MVGLKSMLGAALVAIIFALLLGSVAAAPPPQKEKRPGLFTDAAGVSVQSVPPDRGLIRSRPVTIDLNQVGGGGGVSVSGGAPQVADVISLNLFDNVQYSAVLDTIEPQPDGGLAWIGRVQNIEPSQVVLVVNQGQMAGNIAVPGAFYGVRYLGGNTHAVVEIDQSAYPGDTPIPVDLPENPAPIQAAADDGSQIDLLVAYTAITRQAAGGTTAMQNLINLAVTETNQSYANSGINQRLRLAGTSEVSYAESGNIETDLNRLKSTSDGYMDNLHALRDSAKADLVALIVENGGGFCGIAFLMTGVSTTFASSGFSVTARDCATGYYSFGHELGHNMGARHDWAVDSGTTPYSYAHGYVNTTNRWRTIMAYNTVCANSGFNCTRLPYWSNPNLSYNGAPLGAPIGSAQPADNHQTLNNTAFTVANFRQSGGTTPAVGPLVYNSNTIDDDSLNESSGNNNGVAECGETIETLVTLRNQGSTTASGVNAAISTGSPYVTVLFNTSSAYPDVPGGGTAANTNDFDLKIDANAPDGALLQFNLAITAANGGPWSAAFVVPVTCNPTSGDSYEPDNSNTLAKPITAGAAQTHSIYPATDQDWVKFTVPHGSGITLETSGTPGDDTRLWLYNGLGNTIIDFNDDINLQDGNFFSRIIRTCDAGMLATGTYYAKVDEYGNNNLIGAYDLSLSISSCVDTYENDDSSGQAKTIIAGAAQKRSIVPAGDVDWVKFTLNTPSKVILATSGKSGDTIMKLFNSSLTQIDENDDGFSNNLFSRLAYCNQNSLAAGTYYVQIEDYGNDNEIGSYTLSFVDDCKEVFLPIVLK